MLIGFLGPGLHEQTGADYQQGGLDGFHKIGFKPVVAGFYP